jgi:glycosyltransferase involved in cell wall biosynthesis
VTPVYNAEKYLPECIESVLGQTYENWQYVLVNNGSTDRSPEIAQSYAQKDIRIQVLNNSKKLSMIQNWNRALNRISASSKYCKVVHADDWMFPECLQRMVNLAEDHPTVGIVGSYRLDHRWVNLDGLPYPSTVVRGKEICRSTLLGHAYVFGSPSSLLIRCDLIRSRGEFYNPENPHADTEACYEILRNTDFGFVHQVLTYTRRHNESETTFARRFNSYLLGNMICLLKYGPIYLSKEEYEDRFAQLIAEYYRFLGGTVFRRDGREILHYHEKELRKLGQPVSRLQLARVCFSVAVDYLLHPIDSMSKVIARMREKREK